MIKDLRCPSRLQLIFLQFKSWKKKISQKKTTRTSSRKDKPKLRGKTQRKLNKGNT